MSAGRNDILDALLDRLADSYQFVTKSRRLKLWTDVPASMRPALFLVDHDDDYARQQSLGVRTMAAEAFVYIDAHDPAVVGSSVLNDILDAFDTALKPTAAEDGLASLGGRAAQVFVEGPAFKDPGDLDGDGVLIVPIKIRLP